MPIERRVDELEQWRRDHEREASEHERTTNASISLIQQSQARVEERVKAIKERQDIEAANQSANRRIVLTVLLSSMASVALLVLQLSGVIGAAK